MVRPVVLALCALVLLNGAPPHDQQPLTPDEWVRIVRQHRPGEWDDAARVVARLGAADLRELGAALEPRFGPRALPFPGRNATLLAGAALHADVAMRTSYGATPTSPGDRSVILSLDGRTRGSQHQNPEWTFARRLLDGVSPDPAATRVMQLWYRATAAYMAGSGRFADAEPHLARARESFPRDADLLCDSGWFWEETAAPRIQAVLAELVPRADSRAREEFDFHYPGVGEALKKAEAFFTEALDADPAHIEARLRRGRVRTLRGHGKEALEDLTAALGAKTDPEQRYLTLLFLGSAHEAMQRTGPAREAYTGAAELFPLAQSPHLALSRLAIGRGDMAGAQRQLRELRALPPSGVTRPDPWWSYPLGSGRHARDLLGQLSAAVEALRGSES